MTEEKPVLTAQEAATVLAAAASLVEDPLKAAVRQVAGKQPITGKQRAELEAVVADGEAKQSETETVAQAGPTENPDAPLGRPGRKAERDLAVHARRRMIVKLRFCCPPMEIRAIAKKLHIAPVTVISDLNAIRKERAELWTGTKGQEMISDAIDKLELIAAEAMAISKAHKAPGTRLNAFREARNALESKVAMMQDSGMAPRAPTKVEAKIEDNRPPKDLEALHRELLSEIKGK